MNSHDPLRTGSLQILDEDGLITAEWRLLEDITTISKGRTTGLWYIVLNVNAVVSPDITGEQCYLICNNHRTYGRVAELKSLYVNKAFTEWLITVEEA